MAAKPRVLTFEVVVDRNRASRSELGGSVLEREDEWWAEHLVLAALVRCSLASVDHSARRAGFEVTGAGNAEGTVTRRDDGRYGFVDIAARLEVELDPEPEPTAARALVEKAERGCFIGNSLVPAPRYRWTVNGDEIR